MEVFAEEELSEWCSVLATEFGAAAFLENKTVVKGGIEFQCGEQVGLCLNACLKIPSRILQRVWSFNTREWKVVEDNFNKIPWKHYFGSGISDWEIAASESKFNNEKYLRTFLEEKCRGRHYQENPKAVTAYLRVHNNQFTVSRDTSGEHLHFRGYRKEQGEAPLRENLASFLWAFLLKSQSRLAAEDAVIVDPFCGSGTLLFEAALWNQWIQSRSFAASPWIEMNTQERLAKIMQRLKSWHLNLIGVDSDVDVIDKANNNGMEFKRRQPACAATISFRVGDSVAGIMAEPLPKDKVVWLLSNPPYGGKGRLKTEKSWRELWGGALRYYQPEWAVALGPEKDCRKGDKLEGWECIETHRFLNGGLRVVASLWKKGRGKSQ